MMNVRNEDSCFMASFRVPVPLYSGPRVPGRFLGYLILNMKAVRCFGKSVNIYHSTRQKIAKEAHDNIALRSSNFARYRIFKFHNHRKFITTR
jgi:hypothetical protein